MRCVALATGMMLMTAWSAWGQTTPVGEAWVPDVNTEVRVTGTSGVPQVGRFRSLDDETLRVLVGDQELALPRASIVRVERRGDRLLNGFLIGAAVGLIPAAFISAEVEAGGGNVAAAIVIGSGTYGLIGMGIDALHKGWTTVYDRPRTSARRRHFWISPSAHGMRVGYTRSF